MLKTIQVRQETQEFRIKCNLIVNLEAQYGYHKKMLNNRLI